MNHRALAASSATIVLLLGIAVYDRFIHWSFPVESLLMRAESAQGTPARLEREYKLDISGIPGGDTPWVAQKIREALQEAVGQEADFEAPKVLKRNYYLTGEDVPFLYRDIYFDTADGFNYSHDIAYRLRHRWKTLVSFQDYKAGHRDRGTLPIRCEIQSKVGRKEYGQGYSESMEGRFEFRDASPPFHELKSAPLPPWPVLEYVPYVIFGEFRRAPTTPGVSYAAFVEKIKDRPRHLVLGPVLANYSRRTRLHLNMKTPWGSGPNPYQAFIITLDAWASRPVDRFELEDESVFNISDYTRGLSDLVTELEIEFERNVSDVLDDRIEDAKKRADSTSLRGLEQARQAFLDDQKRIGEIIVRKLNAERLTVVAMNRSKYCRGVELQKDLFPHARKTEGKLSVRSVEAAGRSISGQPR